MTTSRLLPAPASTAENAARVRKAGIAAVPTTARAPLRRNTLRVMDIRQLLAASSWLLAQAQGGSQRPTTDLPSLKIWRSQQQAGDRTCVRWASWIIQLALADFR